MKFLKKQGRVCVTRGGRLRSLGGIKYGELGIGKKLDDGRERIVRSFLVLWAFFLRTLIVVFLEDVTA